MYSLHQTLWQRSPACDIPSCNYLSQLIKPLAKAYSYTQHEVWLSYGSAWNALIHFASHYRTSRTGFLQCCVQKFVTLPRKKSPVLLLLRPAITTATALRFSALWHTANPTESVSTSACRCTFAVQLECNASNDMTDCGQHLQSTRYILCIGLNYECCCPTFAIVITGSGCISPHIGNSLSLMKARAS